MDHPLTTNPARNQRVRERAYHLWEANGKPHGRDIEFWERACAQVAMEETALLDLRTDPQTHPEPARQTRVARSDIENKPGEPPEQIADRQDAQPTPTPRRSPGRRRRAPASPAKKPKKP